MTKSTTDKELNPQPKNKPIRLNGKAYKLFKKQVAYRAMGYCERCCIYAPDGDIHHKKSRGAGGSDTMENCMWLCRECHTEIHMGL